MDERKINELTRIIKPTNVRITYLSSSRISIDFLNRCLSNNRTDLALMLTITKNIAQAISELYTDAW